MASKHRPANDADENAEVELGDIDDRLSQELVVALVGPVGSGCTTVGEEIARALREDYGYDPVLVRLSGLIKDHAQEVNMEIPEGLSNTERVDRYQDVGNELRETFGDEYIADRAIEQIAVERDQRKGYAERNGKRIVLPHRRVYLLDSLKNPAELKRLRQVYGDLLWVVSVFAPEEIRLARLAGMGMEDADARYAMKRDLKKSKDLDRRLAKPLTKAISS